MVDFLIKNTNNWMDSLTDGEASARGLSFYIGYTQRYSKGDVLEIAEDNRWGDHQHGNGKFLIIRVPFLSIEQSMEYIQPLRNQTGEIIKRRRYRFWLETVSEEVMQEHQIAPFVYKVDNIEELLLFGQDKFDEAE